jgi:hypothetical protein
VSSCGFSTYFLIVYDLLTEVAASCDGLKTFLLIVYDFLDGVGEFSSRNSLYMLNLIFDIGNANLFFLASN